jgi:hypothetical protein
VNDYDALRDYLKKQTRPEFVLRFVDAALPRAAQRASWWETLRSPQEKCRNARPASPAATSPRGSPTATACGSSG